MRYTHDDLRRALCSYLQLKILVQRIPFTVTTPAETAELLLGLWLDLRHGLQSLSTRQREAVFYYLILGASEADAATRLHISRQSLHERVEAALRRMCAAWEVREVIRMSEDTPSPTCKPSLWHWNTVQRLLAEEGSSLAKDDLHVRRLTRAMNRLDDRTRYKELRFRAHETPCDPWRLGYA